MLQKIVGLFIVMFGSSGLSASAPSNFVRSQKPMFFFFYEPLIYKARRVCKDIPKPSEEERNRCIVEAKQERQRNIEMVQNPSQILQEARLILRERTGQGLTTFESNVSEAGSGARATEQ